jgi:hypothetical protein
MYTRNRRGCVLGITIALALISRPAFAQSPNLGKPVTVVAENAIGLGIVIDSAYRETA